MRKLTHTDPTRQEMLAYLAEQFGKDVEEIDTEAAIFWFAVNWHSGQWSDLYASTCASPYRPGAREHKCRADALTFYAALENRFSQ